MPSLPMNLFGSCVSQGEAHVVALPLREVVHWQKDVEAAKGVKKFCGYDESQTAVVVVAEDLMEPFEGSKINKKRVLLSSQRGQMGLDPKQFGQLVSSLAADAVVFPTNEPAHDGSVKSQDKSVNGTLQYMDACKLVGAHLVGSIGGGSNDQMRDWSIEQTTLRGLSSFMLSGISRAGSFDETMRVVQRSIAALPKEKMKFAQGNFTLAQVLELVRAGVDVVGSILPMTKGASGIALLDNGGEMDLNNPEILLDKTPIDSACACHTCQQHSRGYIAHLLATKEMLAGTLLTIHNLHLFKRMFQELRQRLYQGPQ